MANENERKHDPAENRREEMGHRWDDAKTGGGEKNVGQTGGSVGGSSAGTNAPVGGSASFLAGENQSTGSESGQGGASATGQAEPNQVLTGDGGGDSNFGGRTGSGTSAMAANNSRADLGAAGVGPNGQQSGIESGGTPGAFVGSEQQDSGDYVQDRSDEPNQGGFAEQGRGAPEGSGPEGSGERQANADTDVEGSSKR